MLPPQPRARTRRRLYSFDTFLELDTRWRWIDRLKFGINTFEPVRLGPDDFVPYLRQRRASEPSNLFSIETPSRRKVRIIFGRRTWLFDLTLTFTFFDGAWRGKGSLEANPTRLFSLAGRRAQWEGTPEIADFDLTRPPFEPANPTLDGRDNMVPDEMLGAAIRTDWPLLVERYLEAICIAVEENLGRTIDRPAGARRADTGAAAFDPVISMPPPHTWTLKEAEVYAECHDENALFRMHEIASQARGLSREFHRQEYVRPNPPAMEVHAEERQANAISIRLGLSAAGTRLTAYAKSPTRLRFEIGYKDYPLQACRLTASDYHRVGGVRDMMRDISHNASRRIAAVKGEYRRLNSGSAGTLPALTTALHAIHVGAGHDAVSFGHMVALLCRHLGVSPSDNPRLQRMADELTRRDILQPSRSALRGSAELVLAPRYRAAFERLRQLLSSD